MPSGYVLPVLSVGVQGDSRTYRSTLALEHYTEAAFAEATERINQLTGVNRVVALVQGVAPLSDFQSHISAIDETRLARLRDCDSIVRKLSIESGFEERIWPFPVVLILCGVEGKPDSVVLRTIDSVDGMTAKAVSMPAALLEEMPAKLMKVPGIAAVFFDLTNKPPATIEWE